jgi:hypothetical protein
MKSFDNETRTAAALRQRLLAGPEEMRAIATAETADWERPDFAIDAAQQEAMEATLRACGDARAAVLGDAADSAFDDDNRAPDEPTRLRWRVASERRTALDRAIAAGARAGRLLRQRGMKATVATSERVDAAGQSILAYAVLGFRRRAVDTRAA